MEAFTFAFAMHTHEKTIFHSQMTDLNSLQKQLSAFYDHVTVHRDKSL